MRAMQMKVLTIYLNCDKIITEGELKGSLVKVFTLLRFSIVEMMMNVAKRSASQVSFCVAHFLYTSIQQIVALVNTHKCDLFYVYSFIFHFCSI